MKLTVEVVGHASEVGEERGFSQIAANELVLSVEVWKECNFSIRILHLDSILTTKSNYLNIEKLTRQTPSAIPFC